MLSNTSKYALRAIIYIALNEDKKIKTGIKKISEDLDIPAPFLAKILQLLARNKILNSTKGPNGGFGFNKPPESISLFDIVTIIDGSDLFERCLISMRTCNDHNVPCPLHESYQTIRTEIVKLFKEQNVGSLATNIKMQEQVFAL